MTVTLEKTLKTLRDNEPMLRARGVLHAAVFGSVARGAAGPDSDIDLLVELEAHNPCGMFEYARLRLDISDMLGAHVDLIERRALKFDAKAAAIRDAVDAF